MVQYFFHPCAQANNYDPREYFIVGTKNSERPVVFRVGWENYFCASDTKPFSCPYVMVCGNVFIWSGIIIISVN